MSDQADWQALTRAVGETADLVLRKYRAQGTRSGVKLQELVDSVVAELPVNDRGMFGALVFGRCEDLLIDED